MANLADALEAAARLDPEAPAIIFGDRVTTWKAFEERAGGLARHLVDAGLEHQSKVAVYLRNGPEHLETVFAVLKAGMIPINVNYRYGPIELRYLFDNADVEAVVFDEAFAPVVKKLRPEMPEVRHWYLVGAAEVSDVTPYESAVRHRSSEVEPRRDPDDVMMIYTGGTTGMPKGVMWRQSDLVSMLTRKARGTPSSPSGGVPDGPAHSEEVYLIACPLMHGTGLFMALAALLTGATVVTLTGATFDPRELCRAISAQRVTAVILVGDAFSRPLLRLLDTDPDAYDISSIRSITSAGAMWSRDVKEGLLRHNDAMALIDSFGASEVSGLGRSVSTARTIKGTAVFDISEHAHLVDERGEVIGPESTQPGMVEVGGPLPLGYYKDPEKTSLTFRIIGGQRVAVTGDWAHYTPDGEMMFLGRGSGCINSGGEKIFPEEVEEAIKLHPDVADAAVLGVPHELFGQMVVALVEPLEGREIGEPEIVDHVRHQVAGFKVPRQVWFVSSLERTPSGKLDSERLRSMADSLLQ